ncbi:PilZ domain-containing protein [bacterium]|nr:MAG: PilZ domain-containing protein [bacterium]
MTTNRRRYFRQPVALPVRVRLLDGSSWQAVTLDLSVRGTRLLAPDALPAGSKAKLTIGAAKGVTVRAEVRGVRSVADRFEIHLSFDALAPALEEILYREVRAAERRALRERSEARSERLALETSPPVTATRGGERRRSRRVRVEASARMRVGTAYVGAKILDISSGGAKVRLAQVMRVGERVILPIPGCDDEVRAVVRSVRVRAKDLHFEIGVRFEFADVHQARTVRAQIAELRRAAEALAPA